MKIAVLGLGIIGSIWARHLAADGHEMKCWNRTPRKDFPGVSATAAEAVESAEAILLVVADPPAVRTVIDQIAPALERGQMLIQASTISAEWTLKFAREIRKTGVLFIEAPFTGSKPAAEQRKTVFYLGGDPGVAEKAKPVLGPLSSVLFYVGELGSASTLKLAMNLNIAQVGQALCESLAMCRAAHIPDDVYFKALSLNASRSGLSDFKGPKLKEQDYSPQFSLKHMDKDLRLALETAAALGLTLEQTARLKKLYDLGMARGWQEEDFIGLIRLLEGRGGRE
ncbi:MAG TPA: NAD(P)-dependent oxidoreductase [Candidatus Omnitrophota bacterium]|jgi:3-hydroxyisobutyrate dehydrogenase-like beta-hydroxyacid dehydrogenase|nr:NAD(P)-dependent oxidoreductase [Candidatus Omnitrophota bacterium]